MTCVQKKMYAFRFSELTFYEVIFVKNTAKIRAQQTNYNIAKIFIYTRKVQRPICGSHRILSLKMNKTSRDFITTICLFNTAFLIFKIVYYRNRVLKEVKMPNTGYTDRQKVQCVLWMTGGLRGTAIQKNVSTNIVYRIHQYANHSLVPKLLRPW